MCNYIKYISWDRLPIVIIYMYTHAYILVCSYLSLLYCYTIYNMCNHINNTHTKIDHVDEKVLCRHTNLYVSMYTVPLLFLFPCLLLIWVFLFHFVSSIATFWGVSLLLMICIFSFSQFTFLYWRNSNQYTCHTLSTHVPFGIICFTSTCIITPQYIFFFLLKTVNLKMRSPIYPHIFHFWCYLFFLYRFKLPSGISFL
jgi:hypothetical protein